MKRDNEEYRLAEDNFKYGLEGKITMGKYISQMDMAIYDRIDPRRNEYPERVTVETEQKHSGSYAFEDKEAVEKFIEKVTGGSYRVVDNTVAGVLAIDSHKGRFIFTMTTMKKPL